MLCCSSNNMQDWQELGKYLGATQSWEVVAVSLAIVYYHQHALMLCSTEFKDAECFLVEAVDRDGQLRIGFKQNPHLPVTSDGLLLSWNLEEDAPWCTLWSTISSSNEQCKLVSVDERGWVNARTSTDAVHDQGRRAGALKQITLQCLQGK